MDSVDEDLEPTGGQATPALHKSAELAGYARTFLLGSALPVETREELEASSLPTVCCQAALGWRSCAFAGRGEREIGGGYSKSATELPNRHHPLDFPLVWLPKVRSKSSPTGQKTLWKAGKGSVRSSWVKLAFWAGCSKMQVTVS